MAHEGVNSFLMQCIFKIFYTSLRIVRGHGFLNRSHRIFYNKINNLIKLARSRQAKLSQLENRIVSCFTKLFSGIVSLSEVKIINGHFMPYICRNQKL